MKSARHWLIAAFALSVLCTSLQAQGTPTLGTPLSTVAVVDTDALYQGTKLGQRMASDLEARARVLQAENKRLTESLTDEEQDLTNRRETMEPEAFRAAAAEFDARVQGIRRSRDAAIAAFEEERQNAPKRFLDSVRNILGQIMVERGAVAILNQQIVLLSLSTIDMTEDAIARIDLEFGDGSTSSDQAPADPDTP